MKRLAKLFAVLALLLAVPMTASAGVVDGVIDDVKGDFKCSVNQAGNFGDYLVDIPGSYSDVVKEADGVLDAIGGVVLNTIDVAKGTAFGIVGVAACWVPEEILCDSKDGVCAE